MSEIKGTGTGEITVSDKCQYPNCRCPFDMGPDNLCLIGKPNPKTQSSGEKMPLELTDTWCCPDCGSSLHPADIGDPECDEWWCGECGFNDPEKPGQIIVERGGEAV